MTKKNELTTEEKLSALDNILVKMKKKYGTAIKEVEENSENIYIPKWKLSSPLLTYVMDGGLPKGRTIEFFGTEGGCKTSLSLKIASDIQKQHGYVVFMDAEHTFDYQWAKKHGVNISKDNLG